MRCAHKKCRDYLLSKAEPAVNAIYASGRDPFWQRLHAARRKCKGFEKTNLTEESREPREPCHVRVTSKALCPGGLPFSPMLAQGPGAGCAGFRAGLAEQLCLRGARENFFVRKAYEALAFEGKAREH